MTCKFKPCQNLLTGIGKRIYCCYECRYKATYIKVKRRHWREGSKELERVKAEYRQIKLRKQRKRKSAQMVALLREKHGSRNYQRFIKILPFEFVDPPFYYMEVMSKI